MADKQAEEKKKREEEASSERTLARKEPEAERRLARDQPTSGPLSPFGMMRGFIEDVGRLFADWGMPLPSLFGTAPGRISRFATTGMWIPEVEVFEQDGNLIVRADVPGMTEKDVDVEIRGDSLIVSGERHHEVEQEQGSGYRSERSYGSFLRQIELPDGVDPERIEAKLQNGVLEVCVPLEAGKRKKIAIRSEASKGATAERGGRQEEAGVQTEQGTAQPPSAAGTEAPEERPLH